MRLLLPLLLAASTLVLAGCNTFERRAQKKADTFARLAPQTQERLRSKQIQIGDTPDMVYIALGNPDEKHASQTASGETLTWTYNRYWQEYRGEAFDGYMRRAVRDPKTGATSFYYEPVSRPVYAQREEPVLRIVFADGKVSVIEQAKR